MFDLVVLNRRKRWEWRVSDRNGKVIMRGSEPTRQEAKYKAHRALFLLLSQAGSYSPSQTLKGPQPR
jgi:hypothetical protein